jgi:hypothetical protein
VNTGWSVRSTEKLVTNNTEIGECHGVCDHFRRRSAG